MNSKTRNAQENTDILNRAMQDRTATEVYQWQQEAKAQAAKVAVAAGSEEAILKDLEKFYEERNKLAKKARNNVKITEQEWINLIKTTYLVARAERELRVARGEAVRPVGPPAVLPSKLYRLKMAVRAMGRRRTTFWSACASRLSKALDPYITESIKISARLFKLRFVICRKARAIRSCFLVEITWAV